MVHHLLDPDGDLAHAAACIATAGGERRGPPASIISTGRDAGQRHRGRQEQRRAAWMTGAWSPTAVQPYVQHVALRHPACSAPSNQPQVESETVALPQASTVLPVFKGELARRCEAGFAAFAAHGGDQGPRVGAGGRRRSEMRRFGATRCVYRGNSGFWCFLNHAS